MSVLIKGMEKPKDCSECPLVASRGYCPVRTCIFVEVPTPHGRLIDADALRREMYHQAFETDTDMQRWDSGCWIRYKLFESAIDDAQTVVEGEE